MSIRPEIHEKNPHLGENYLLLLQVTVFTQARPDHPDTNPLLGSHCFCRKQRRLQPLPIRHCHHWCPSLRHLWSVSSAQIYLQAENKIADSACSPRMLRGTINECTGQWMKFKVHRIGICSAIWSNISVPFVQRRSFPWPMHLHLLSPQLCEWKLLPSRTAPETSILTKVTNTQKINFLLSCWCLTVILNSIFRVNEFSQFLLQLWRFQHWKCFRHHSAPVVRQQRHELCRLTTESSDPSSQKLNFLLGSNRHPCLNL